MVLAITSASLLIRLTLCYMVTPCGYVVTPYGYTFAMAVLNEKRKRHQEGLSDFPKEPDPVPGH